MTDHDDTHQCQIMRDGKKRRSRCPNPSEFIHLGVHVCSRCFSEAMECCRAMKGEGDNGALYYYDERAMPGVNPKEPTEKEDRHGP